MQPVRTMVERSKAISEYGKCLAGLPGFQQLQVPLLMKEKLDRLGESTPVNLCCIPVRTTLTSKPRVWGSLRPMAMSEGANETRALPESLAAPYLRPSRRSRSAFFQSPERTAFRKETMDVCSSVTPDSASNDFALDLVDCQR